MEQLFKDLAQAVLTGDYKQAPELVQKGLAAKVSPGDLLNQGLLTGMDEVGRLFREGEYYVPEVLISARAMRFAMKELKPELVSSGVEPKGRVALGTVKGDLHDIGKDLVAMMLEGAGYQVADLGKDVAPDAFVEAVRSGAAQVIGLSALLTTTMVNMKATIEALAEAGLRDKVKVMIGGAPVTARYAAEIGADAYGVDAVAAVEQVGNLIGA